MKSSHWQGLLRSHPLFSRLREEDITELLTDEISQERSCPQDTLLLKEGDNGDSMFLISSGSVEVSLKGTGGPTVSLATLRAGEIFGEMAVLERKPRSATVRAKEQCLLLEITGEYIRKLLEIYPEVQVKMYTLARDRLRHWFQSLGGDRGPV